MADITVTMGAYEIGADTDLDYLIGSLRTHIGDYIPPFRFSDGFLRRALVDGFKALTKRWKSRYEITASGLFEPSIVSGIDYSVWTVERTTYFNFPVVAPPTILVEDEQPIILSASITIKRGLLQSSHYTVGSWRDDEISFSNIRGSELLLQSLAKDEKELEDIFPSRANKLAKSRKQSLLGFNTPNNYFEGDW